MIFIKKLLLLSFASAVGIQSIGLQASSGPVPSLKETVSNYFMPDFTKWSSFTSSLAPNWSSDDLKKYGFFAVGILAIGYLVRSFMVRQRAKEYLKSWGLRNALPQFTPFGSTSYTNDKEAGGGVIPYAGRGSMPVIRHVLEEFEKPGSDKEALKLLLADAEDVFDKNIVGKQGEYTALSGPFDKKKLLEIDWKIPRKPTGEQSGFSELQKYYSLYDEKNNPIGTSKYDSLPGAAYGNVDKTKLSKSDFWLFKTLSIAGSGLRAKSAEEACKLFNLWEKYTTRFGNDPAFNEARSVACERASIEAGIPGLYQ